MGCRERAALDKQHADLHYGKYSSGYSRGWARASDERFHLAQNLHACRILLRELAELNAQCDGDLLPPEFAARIERLIE